MIDLAKVKSVYSGIDGKCCCGCAGKHSTSERSKKLLINKMNKLNDLKYSDCHVWAVNGKRLYIAYFQD